jgi:hypothetical protein
LAKKFLRKNEIRTDLNPVHLNKHGSPHEAVITAKHGHKFKANTKIHSKFVDGVECLDLEPNLPDNVKHKRISPPFWQSEKQFGNKKGKASKVLRNKIKKYNKKFY